MIIVSSHCLQQHSSLSLSISLSISFLVRCLKAVDCFDYVNLNFFLRCLMISARKFKERKHGKSSTLTAVIVIFLLIPSRKRKIQHYSHPVSLKPLATIVELYEQIIQQPKSLIGKFYSFHQYLLSCDSTLICFC